MKEVIIDNVTYVEKEAAASSDKYVIIRTYSAGVHAGYLKEKNGTEVILTNARRIWKWCGAASLSQLAMEGTTLPCYFKFPCAVNEITLQWIEIIPCTEQGREIIQGVDVWSA